MHSLLEKLVDLCCFVIESQNHLGWKGPLEISAAQTSCSSWASESILPVIICLFFITSSWVFIQVDEIPLNLLIRSLNSPISFSLWWYKSCSNSLTIFVALLWICFSKPVYFLHWEVQQWTQFSKSGIPNAE